MGSGVGVAVAVAGIAVGGMVGTLVGANAVGSARAPDPHALRSMKPIKTTGNVLLNVMVVLLFLY